MLFPTFSSLLFFLVLFQYTSSNSNSSYSFMTIKLCKAKHAVIISKANSGFFTLNPDRRHWKRFLSTPNGHSTYNGILYDFENFKFLFTQKNTSKKDLVQVGDFLGRHHLCTHFCASNICAASFAHIHLCRDICTRTFAHVTFGYATCAQRHLRTDICAYTFAHATFKLLTKNVACANVYAQMSVRK
jgi:hypothetical protein